MTSPHRSPRRQRRSLPQVNGLGFEQRLFKLVIYAKAGVQKPRVVRRRPEALESCIRGNDGVTGLRAQGRSVATTTLRSQMDDHWSAQIVAVANDANRTSIFCS